MNMARAELLGWGVQVTYQNLTETSLSWALNEVLSNSRYKENVLKISRRLTDQPQSAMDKAIFWIEYVSRHDGAYFMQTSAQYLSFIEYHNLDIYTTFMLIAFLIIFIPIYVIKKTMKFICSVKKCSSKTSKKKNN